jgi:hypothetical protein
MIQRVGWEEVSSGGVLSCQISCATVAEVVLIPFPHTFLVDPLDCVDINEINSGVARACE